MNELEINHRVETVESNQKVTV